MVGPIFEHIFWYHSVLNLFEDFPKNLLAGLATSGLHGGQSLIVSCNGIIVVEALKERGMNFEFTAKTVSSKKIVKLNLKFSLYNCN